MNEALQSEIAQLVLLLLISVALLLIKTYLKKLLVSAVNNLVQIAEAQITGSGLGETKKKWVLAQLEAAGIAITKGISALIDDLVAQMNAKKTSLADAVAETVDSVKSQEGSE